MSFYAIYDRIVPAANKYMATLFNTSTTRRIVVSRVARINRQVTAVVGVLLEQELRFITARTAGASITPITEDSADTLSAGITADTGSTAVTEGTGSRGLILPFLAISEEISATKSLAAAEGATGWLQDAMNIYWQKSSSKGLVLRQNQGITIKNLTASIVGSVSYIFEFDDVLL